MLRRLAITIICCLALVAQAQNATQAQVTALPQDTTQQQGAAQQGLKFGYVSYQALLTAMPDYALAQTAMAQLREKYDAEQKRVEDDFNQKYEEFLDVQRNFPQTILQKRQSELQEMLDKNIAFKKESQRLLAEAEAEALAPLKERLNAALIQVGQEQGYAFILNTDQQAAPFINPAMGEDATELVKAVLR